MELKELEARRRRILYGRKEEEVDDDKSLKTGKGRKRKDVKNEEEAILYVERFDGVKERLENDLRRASGVAKQLEIAAALGVDRLPHADMVYYDSYRADVIDILPNPLYRLIRVYDMDGSVLEEEAILLIKYDDKTQHFFPRDKIYVEPSSRIEGKYDLVGHYNIKGMRLE